MAQDDPAEDDSNSESSDELTVKRDDDASALDVKRHDGGSKELSGDLVPAVNWQNLPRIDFGSFVSSKANAVDALCKELGSEHSRRTYVSRLNKIGRMLETPMTAERIPWYLLRYEHVLEIKTALERAGDSPATINGTLSAIRKVTQVCVRLKHMDREDMMAIHDIKTIKYQRLPKGREIRAGELEALIRVCREDSNQMAGWRDIAVIGFLCSCATCHVHVEAEWVGAVGEPSDNEESMLDLNPERLANSRLCCQIKVTESLGGLVVRVPEFQF